MKSYIKVDRAFTLILLIFALITVLMVILGSNLQKFYPLLADKGASWYFWKLPEANLSSRLSSWIGYGLHQLFVWIILIFALKNKAMWEKSDYLNIFNLLIILVNFFFVILHLIQTQLFYDGLAQDVPIWSSQGSVIVMLVFIFYLMIPKRGLIFGKKFQPPKNIYNFLLKFHGLYISWALIYTFWFHPMEGNYICLDPTIHMGKKEMVFQSYFNYLSDFCIIYLWFNKRVQSYL